MAGVEQAPPGDTDVVSHIQDYICISMEKALSFSDKKLGRVVLRAVCGTYSRHDPQVRLWST